MALLVLPVTFQTADVEALPFEDGRYDVVLSMKPEWSNRTSYVIAPDGKILLSYTDGNFQGHVTQTMDAVKAYKAKK